MMRCGTVRGYFDHRKNGEPTCAECRQAKREYQAGRASNYGTCLVDGCADAAEARSLCSRHLDRFYRHGDPLAPKPTLVDRFWSKVVAGPVPNFAPHLGPCWLWSGKRTSQGYGATTGQVLSHRFSYELNVAPIPQALTIDHLCMVRLCVNPTHLEAVTRAENTRRELVARKIA